MINFKNITQAAETLLMQQVGDDYIIERNPVRPSEPWRVMREGKKGWIGIYRGNVSYAAHSTGNNPYLAEVRFTFVVQVASVKSQEDCEDKLCDAEKEIIDILEDDRKDGKMGGYLHNIVGFEIDYETNEDDQTYYQAVLITPIAQVRT